MVEKRCDESKRLAGRFLAESHPEAHRVSPDKTEDERDVGQNCEGKRERARDDEERWIGSILHDYAG